MPLVLVTEARCTHRRRPVIEPVQILARAFLVFPGPRALVPTVCSWRSCSHLVRHLLDDVRRGLVAGEALGRQVLQPDAILEGSALPAGIIVIETRRCDALHRE